MNKIICGNCVDVMAMLKPESIDLVVTSPPYDNLRDYEGYDFDFEAIAVQLWRVIKPGGVVVWVVGDATINGSETGTSFRQALHFMEIGFNLHDTMIWDKKGMRFPDANRYNPVFEYMFIFAKGQPKSMNFINDKKNNHAGSKVARKSQTRSKDGKLSENSAWRNNKNKKTKEYGKRDNVWRIHTGGGCGESKHPAFYPEALARDHIISWSNPGDLVLDPMCGSGTTLKMAKQTGRNFIGIDMSENYCNIARKRVNGALTPLPGMLP